ncbi:MAG: hypothetical protein PHY53_02335 [Methanobacterium formicicum]|jgi:hypothetical protein|uniref:Glycosyltransferase RgtA/B/C/D-like domain-containing protein n=2 Tax=Methanobacterium TaxID=2160 RepID=A0A089ZGD2_METFO|nr:hypothetical protein [Methanobacterium formicicum]AIS32110.1 hypothetical protein BRM9_1295 [Methanobacterium formicicum]MDD4810007.1 hypothetical protein [Methanobacterium formicicum]MDG3547396.1 hypothetical protein [Methanobacterium formicicum]CEL24656.1 hypothetical protein MB9_1017 [Methanobacterium formicicum]
MDHTSINSRKYLILIPAIAALIIALIPTLKYQWPLGWDIIYHVQYAQVYAHNGFTLINPLLNAPVGQKIGYPPLFHFLIAAMGTGLGIDFFQVARLLQPLLAMAIVLSVSYVAYKLYGEIAGIGAGFLMLSSMLVERMILALPENLALIFIPLAVYLYYRSIQDKKLKMAILGGLLFILVIGTHQAATLCLGLTIITITLMELVVYRDFKVLGNFVSFFLLLMGIVIAGVVALQIFAPELLQTIMQQGISALTGMSTSLDYSRSLGIYSYLGNIGALVLIFSVIGAVFALKNHRRKDNLILVWIMVMIILSNAYLLGVNVITYRVLIYLLIPLSILGGYGIKISCCKIKEYQESGKYPRFSSPNIRAGFLVVILAISMLSAVLTVTDPDIAVYSAKNEFGKVQIAPPSDSEVDLANWFRENGNQSRSVVISNQFTGMFLATEAGMPLNYGFAHYALKNHTDTPLLRLKEINVGYLVYDKNLVLPAEDKDNPIYMRSINSEFFSLYYFSKNITQNFSQIKPDYATKVYENDDFIVCTIDY